MHATPGEMKSFNVSADRIALMLGRPTREPNYGCCCGMKGSNMDGLSLSVARVCNYSRCESLEGLEEMV
jgi:hypothetical protein